LTAVQAVPVRTFAPIQNVVGREPHGDRVAAKLECGHVIDVAATDTLIAHSCTACKPVEVRRG
jgi:hypothetical protein